MNFKSLLLPIPFFLFSTFVVFSQQPALESFKKTKDSKIQPGMSSQQVKTGIGNPKEVKDGIPDSDEDMIGEFPQMISQESNFTWVYYSEPLIEELDSISQFLVNGKPVKELEYHVYKKLSDVYLYDGKVIHPEMAEGYKLTRSKKLTMEPKNPETTKTVAGTKYRLRVTPVYCVVFDKGTKLVTETRAYFFEK